MKQNIKMSMRGLALAFARLYSFFLFTWFILYLLFGDGSGFLGLANALSIYFFLPLPLLALIAHFYRQRLLWWPLAFGVLIFAWLWGPLFTDQPAPQVDGPRLRVMSFNILGRHGIHEPILDTILAEEADLVFLQEVTPQSAAILSVRLAEAYPYQILDPGPRASGMGVLSRYPIEQLDGSISGNWIGVPQLLSLDWMGQEITLVNFHTLPTGSIWPRTVRRTFERREQDLNALANFAEQQSEFGPLIVAGDANATHLNSAYKSLAAVLQDAWWQAGTGIGHTFPGPYREGNTYASISFFRIPYWLVRIDYIFASYDWSVQNSWLAEFNGGSDHRGVVTELVLLD